MGRGRLGACRELPDDLPAKGLGTRSVASVVSRLTGINAVERILRFVEELLGASHRP